MATVYIIIGVAFYLLQDRILFHPITLKKEQPYDFSFPHTEVNIPIDKQSNLHIVQFHPKDSIKKGVVLYFHGNKKNISRYAYYTSHFTKHGYDVWMIDYPGFGKSTGKFTEKTLYSWADIMYVFAQSKFPEDSIILYGKSMGTGIAAYLASRRNSQRLILETPYYDFPSAVRQYLPIYPVRKMLHYKLPTNEYLKQISVPITIFHGTKDQTIRYNNAKRLQPLLKPTDEFITIKGGGHNNLFRYPLVISKLDSLLR